MSINFASPNEELALPRADAARSRELAPLQSFYLDRLTRLVHKIHLHGRYLASTDRRMQLLNRAVLSTYRACRDLEIEPEARAILAVLRRELVLPAPTVTEVAAPTEAATGGDTTGELSLESQAS